MTRAINKILLDFSPELCPKVCGKATVTPKIEVGSWTSVKTGQATFTYRGTSKKHNHKRMSPFEMVDLNSFFFFLFIVS